MKKKEKLEMIPNSNHCLKSIKASIARDFKVCIISVNWQQEAV
jgi:hypothetical protein